MKRIKMVLKVAAMVSALLPNARMLEQAAEGRARHAGGPPLVVPATIQSHEYVILCVRG
jgi:hypothetical protein